MIPFIDLHAQQQRIKPEIDAAIQRVLAHGKYIQGPEVFELEEKLAEFVGVKHCISCGNGTDALQLALMALGVRDSGDAVFCPTFTFFASGEAIALMGATPVFVDSHERTFNICPEDLEKRIRGVIEEGRLTPKAILAVDLFGLPANYPTIEKIAKKYDLKLIEDAAQGFGGEVHGIKTGRFGDIATTSFFPAKPLGCYGDGGALFTDDDQYAELLRSYRVHGKGGDKYDNVRIGMNSRLDTIQAAVLLVKLTVFSAELSQKKRISEYYNIQLSDEYIKPYIPEGFLSSWAQYTLQVPDRDLAIEKFKRCGIPTMVYYKRCLHQQKAFKNLNYKPGDFPVAEMLAQNVLSLPIHPYMQHHAEIAGNNE